MAHKMSEETAAHRMSQEVLPLFGTQDAQAASGDVSGMDTLAGRRNATQAILEAMTGQTKKQTKGQSK